MEYHIMRIFRKMKNAITNPKQNKKLIEWQRRYSDAKTKYGDDLSAMNEYEGLYNGSRTVNVNPNKGVGKASKVSINVRNIVYELIESQVDSSIPMPKVTPIHAEDEELARVIEVALQNEIRLLHFNVLNDKSERTVPIQGGDFFHVEWDNTKGFHCTIGGLSVSTRHPRTVIPQPGVTEIEEMDYIFVLIPQTKDFIKKRYGKDVSEATDTETQLKSDTKRDENDDIVTVIKCYYRNSNNKIGLFSWCEDFVLEDYEDFQARRLEYCKSCGKVKVGKTCECGSTKFEEREEEYEDILEPIKLMDGSVVDAGEKVPYYKPSEIPIILRRNVSRESKLLGFSDASVVADQQDAIKKLGSKLQEKLLKGGSIVTLPAGKKVETTDEELKIVRINNPNEKALFGVFNMQADVTQDTIMLERNYDWAKSTLGITDSYQGKYDSSAASGTAKQYAINQAAGRLESKRIMKNVAYAKLYEMMFKYLLSYADQPIPLSTKNSAGIMEYAHFNRFNFLRRDKAGELYWNDEFIFETDPTSTIMMNREAMWNQIDLKHQSGAFGQLGDDRTNLAYWTFMEQNDYPNATAMKNMFADRIKETREMQEQIGGMTNEVPIM